MMAAVPIKTHHRTENGQITDQEASPSTSTRLKNEITLKVKKTSSPISKIERALILRGIRQER
jgi:hypothetical protein